jgi:hypothetical protein
MWELIIVAGLSNSKYFIAVISRDALTMVRQIGRDHTWDNVLLEYETALKVSVILTVSLVGLSVC